MAVDEIPQNLDGKGLRIGIVIARFNEYAGRGEYEYCLGELKETSLGFGHVVNPAAAHHYPKPEWIDEADTAEAPAPVPAVAPRRERQGRPRRVRARHQA